jgi:hypothetical protein
VIVIPRPKLLNLIAKPISMSEHRRTTAAEDRVIDCADVVLFSCANVSVQICFGRRLGVPAFRANTVLF